MAEQVKITVLTPDGNQHIIWTLKGKKLWEVLTVNGFDTGGNCSGAGTCGKCRIKVDGDITPLSDSERNQLLAEEIKNGERLACYCAINGAVTVQIDLVNELAYKSRIEFNRERSGENLRVKGRQIFIAGLDKQNPVALCERLAGALPGLVLEISPGNLNELSLLDRVGRPALELYAMVFDDLKVKHIGRKKESAFGIAMDLGSTSLFAALVDMKSGDIAAISSKTNMQRIYGEDIISRISYSLNHETGSDNLHRILINNINSMVDELLKEAAVSAQNIFAVTVVGNPVILHFFLNLNIGGLATAPYMGLFIGEMSLPAQVIGLEHLLNAQVLILPQVGGYVGADTIAGLLTVSDRMSGRYLFIDVGTNGEVVVADRGRLWAASAAAGPAFEGGGISCGMRAGNGAIDRFYLDQDGRLSFNILGDGPARGICGSAVMDLLACLIKAGYIDDQGIMVKEPGNPLNIRASERGLEITIADNQDSRPVVFNQEDIRQIQLAKAAVRTAIDILLKAAAIDYTDLERVYMAGVFGNYLDPENAVITGLLPPVDIKKIKNIGNAAAEGAVMTLLSNTWRDEAGLLKNRIQYIELADNPDFQELFLSNLNFPKLQSP